ncbi:MAG: response regulator [Arenicella sp.]|nr:response regulator [Arenicella sp.]
MKKTFNIGLIGMAPKDVLSMKSLMRVVNSSSRYREYNVVESGKCDILVVNLDSEISREVYRRSTAVVVGAYSESAPTNFKHSIKKPLIGRKVIDVFDRVTVQEFSYEPELTINKDDSSASKQQSLRKLEKLESMSELGFVDDVVSPKRSNIRALVVDDSAVVRKALTMLLAKRNIDVTIARDGREALDIIGQNYHFDIVFLDIVMPEVDGYKVCKELKRSASLKDAKVVMLTSKSSKFDRVRASLVGSDYYLTKPISQLDFLEFIDAFLNNCSKKTVTKNASGSCYRGTGAIVLPA